MATYTISVKREGLRCDSLGSLTTNQLPESFGDITKNRFISASAENRQLIIKTLPYDSVDECYEKLYEITIAALCELHDMDEMLWYHHLSCILPNGMSEVSSSSYISLSIEEDAFHLLRSMNPHIPSDKAQAYLYLIRNYKKSCFSSGCFKAFVLPETGTVDCIDIRVNEINSLDICGISKKELSFITAFIFSCLAYDDPEKISDNGIDQELQKCIEIDKILTLGLTEELEKTDSEYLSGSLSVQKTGPSHSKEFFNRILEQSKAFSQEASDRIFKIRRSPALERSTAIVIKDGLIRGIDYKVIEEEYSFVEFSDGQKSEYVVMATKTRKDTYIFPYVVDDKVLMKELMLKNNLSTPEYINFRKGDYEKYGSKLFACFDNQPIVIKPKSSNCGLGVTVLDSRRSPEQTDAAVQHSIQYDKSILVESYKAGNEYRFFIINGICESVVWRRNASVLGDGIHSIRELIEYRNEHTNTVRAHPIHINDTIIENLSVSGMSIDYVPRKNERIFLQKISNVSQGGDSVEFTEKMPERFKKATEKLARLLGVFICGVDVIIPDTDKDEYYILEINHNPGLVISEVTFEGQGKKLGIIVLKSLGLNVS